MSDEPKPGTQRDPSLEHLRAFEDAQLEANLRSIRAALNGEQARVKFIREAAIAYASTLEQIDGDLSEPEVLGLIWSDARALWDAKPEDC
jgi:hypothetical protein